ncbi:hypothetical protein ACVWZ4_002882 [Bradyrhizobium sp. USDA 4472]
MQPTKETETETKLPICGTAEGDGRALRLVLTGEVVGMATRPASTFTQVVEDIRVATEP